MITMRMKKKRLIWLIHSLIMTTLMLSLFLGFFVASPPGAQAEVPRYINYQGKLTDANDDPVTGDVSVTIRIYDAESGGTALWTETQTVTVTRGVFSILLGNTTALTSMDFNSPYWYSVEVESDGEMTPRQRLTAVAYAINADKIDGYDASDFLAAAPSGALSLTGGANQNVEINPTGTGNVVITIDSTSGDFKITDGTTNFVLVDNATGDVSLTKNLTVTGNITLDGTLSDTSGAVTIADPLTQTGSTNQVTFAGNVDANNGLDVTGALTVSGATTLSSALDMNSNIDLDYSGTSAALDVTQSSTGPAAQFSGGRVLVGASEAANANATATGELYVLGDLEVDGTIYGNISSSGDQSLGATTVSSLIVTGTSDLQGNVSDSGGTFTIADDVSITKTDSSTQGTATLTAIQPTFQDAGTNSTTTAVAMNIAPTVNYTGATKTGSYTALKIAATETSLPTGSNYLIDAYAGADGTTQEFYVDNSGNAKIFGTLDMNSQKITNLATPTQNTDAATKAYADSLTPASAGGWTDGGAGVYLTESTDNVGIGTTSTDTYKLNIAGSTNTTTFYIGGTQVTSTAAELNKVDGYTGTAANLNTLTGGLNADSLHAHAASSLTGDIVSSIDGITNDGGDIDFVEGANMTITPSDIANTITFASSASGDETATTNLTFTIDSDNGGLTAANGAGIIIEGGTGTDISIKFNSGTGNLDMAGVTGGLNIPSGTNYKINGTQIASANLSDFASIGMLNEAETIASDWVNTANPWADNEVANDITASNYLPLAGGTMSGDITLGTAGTNIVTSGINLDLSPASGYGLTSTVTRSAATGDEVAYDLAATINKLTSGNYTGIKLNVTETSAPGASDNLLDLRVGDASKFTVDNAGLVTTASINSASIVNDSITAADLNVNVVSSLDGVTNDGGDIDLLEGANITITPNDGANTITIAATDTVLGQEGAEDYVGGMVSGNTETNIDVTYDDAGGKLNFALSGAPVLAPTSTQTITAADTAATPLILKGMAGQTANLMEVQDSNALSHLTVEADGDVQIDTSGGDALASITQSNTSASLAIATNTAKLGGGAGADSDAVLKMGINEGNYQYIWYDTDAGTDGLGAFIFSDQAVIPTASPAYLNFGVNRDADTGRYSQYYAIKLDPDVSANSSYDKQKFSVVSIPTPGTDFAKYEKPLFDISSDGSFNIYDPSVGDAVFQIEPGGRLAHDFRNLIKNGSFEAFSGFEKFGDYDPNYSQTGVYNNTTTGYRGGWSNFAPDEWIWVEGKIAQHSPALFKTGTGITGTYNTDFYEGKSAVAINEGAVKRGLNYVLGNPASGNDAGIKQVITGLEPNTWYSIGVALMSTNTVTTKAILDITGYYQPSTTITSGIAQGDVLNGTSTSVIAATDTTNFPQGGTILIGSELFDYTGKTSLSFTGVTRGINSTTSSAHTNNAVVTGVFKPLINSSSSFIEKKGSFKTDSTGSDINIYLLSQQTAGANDTEFARFDGVQLVEGKVLPKYSPTSIVDTGDQSIYGTMKIGRSADGRGGILSVDQFVRTRGIDFFSEDPGMSGTAGGSGTVDRIPYSFVNIYSTSAAPLNPGSVKMDVSGNYIDKVLRKFQVKVQGSYDNAGSPGYVKYRYVDCIDSMNEWSESAWAAWTETWYPSGSGIQITTTDTDLAFGVKIRFSDTTGFKGGDQWEFKAYGMSSELSTYSSFNKQASYKPSEARIFRDPSTGELTFEDSNAGKVRLSEIISQRSKAYISPPTRDPNNQGALTITATGELNSSLFASAQNFEVWAETIYDAQGNPVLPPTKFGWSIMWSPNSGTAGTYTWYGNWMQSMNRGSAVSLIASSGQDTGIDITFPATGDIMQYERWRFYASPSSASNIATHHHASDADGGSLAAGNTTSQNFVIGSNTSPIDTDIKLGFGNGVSPNDKFIKWNKDLSQFDVSNSVNIVGTLTATNLSGPTSTSGTSNNTFGVDTDIAGGATEPVQGAGFVIGGGGDGNVNIIYDATSNYLNIQGQAGQTNTFTGINIPTGAKYKINGVNLAPSDINAANSSHSHTAGDLPTAGAAIAGIIPIGGLTDAMVSGTAGIQTSKLADSTGLSDAITKKHTQGTDTALGVMAANIQMGGYKVTGLGSPSTGTDAATKTYVDNAIAGLHWKDPVIAIQSAPPANPANGARYVVNTDGTGAWSGEDNNIAVYNGATWDFTEPLQSYAVFNKADNAGYVYNGASWVAFSGATAYTWGTGLTNSGTTISVDNTVVATLAGVQTLTNKTISGASNTIQSISDSSLNQVTTANKVAGSAVQLNAAGAITNSTGLKVNLGAVNPGLAITDNALDVKLAANEGLTKGASGMQVDYDNATIGIVSNKLAVKGGSIGTAQITDASITSADILDGTIANADISDTAAIAQSKLNLAVTNSEVAVNAAIATSKISGAVTSITNHGLGGLATLSAVSGGDTGTITDGTITNIDIANTAAIAQSKLNLAVTNSEVAVNAAIATSKISGAVTSITNHGLGGLATLNAVSGGAGGTITDTSITDDDIKADAAIATTKLSGLVTSITNHGLGGLATLNAVSSDTITDATITTSDISANAGILDSQLATSPATRFYENFAEYVESGLQPATSVNLTSDISIGTAYVRGARINKATATSKTYIASKDTYVDIDSSGDFQYTAVANGAAIPAIAANSIRLAKVVTDATAITSVTDMRNLYPVTSNEIAPGAVTATGIEDGSIGTAKLADSAVTSIKIADDTIVDDDIAANAAINQSKLALSITNNEVAVGAGISWSKVSKVGSAPADIGAAANSHTHASSDLSGVIFTAPQTAQTMQPTADIVPLTIKGQASANSNVLSIYDAAATPTEKIYVDSAGHIHVAETTTGAAQASSATLYFGRNATDNWETIGYDPALGTKGLFTFSAPLQVEASSPTGITFVEKNSEGAIIKSQGFMYDPAADEFSFTGGKMKQAFQNLVRGGSFESWSTPGWYSAWYSGAYTTTTYAKYGTKSLYIYDSSDTQTAYKAYYIANWDRLKGGNVTLAVWARCDSGTTTASIGIGTNASSNEATVVNNISLTTAWQNFSFTYSVPTNSTSLKVYLYGAAGSNGVPDSSTTSSSGVYYDGVTLAEGKLALEYGPSPVFDTGDQVIGGSLAIGADIDPYNTGYGMNYYRYPRIVFGEPDTHFGGYSDAYSYGGYNYSTYGGGAGEISFRPLNTSSGTFTFNRPIGMDSYEMSNSSWRSPALFIGRLYDYTGGDTVDKPDYAWTTKDAYIKGVVEADGGVYGDIMSFYGGVGKTSNLLTYSEDFTQGAWSKTPSGLQITSGELAPDGTSTASRLTSSVDAAMTQTVSATNSTAYTFSIYLAPGAQNYAYIFLKSNVETEWWTWPNYQYVDLYNTTGWRRFSVTYTTPSSGTTSVMARVMFYGSSGYNSIKVWGAQLRPASAQGIYMKTTSSPVTNSNSLFHGDGSGLTNLSAASISSGTAALTGITGNVFTINEDLVDTPSENLSIAFNRGAYTDSTIVWDESSDKFVINNPVNISNGNLSVAGTITAGTGSNTITTSTGLLDATKLSGLVPTANLPADGYGSTYVNVTGDTMTGALTINQASTGNVLVLQGDGASVVTFAKTGDITLGSGADTITSAASNNFNIKLGDSAGTNKLSVQTQAGLEKFAVLSDGTVKIDGGYTGVLGGGITLQPNGDIYFDGNIYQKGDTYTVDTVRFTGNYDVGLIAKFGVGSDGTDANYLQIDSDGVITKLGSGNSGAVTVNDAFTQTGSASQVTFQGNVDALNGLDVTGNITTTGTVDGIDISSDSWVTSEKIAAGAIATTDLADNAVTNAKLGIGAVAKSNILELRPYATTPNSDNKVNVAAGVISIDSNSRLAFAGGISPAFDPVTANSRIDLLAIDSTGTLVIIPGVQASSPSAPAYPTNKLVVAEVTITETAVQGVVIESSDINDVRPFLNLGSSSGDSSITTTDSGTFTIGRNTDETTNNITLAFGNTAGGQKAITYEGSSSDDFVFNDDVSLGSNSLKFTANTLTDAKVGNYDSHLTDTSNPHSVTAAQVGGTGIVTEINAGTTVGTINANRLASEVLTQTEGNTAYVNVAGDTIIGDLIVQGALTPTTISMPIEASISWATGAKAVFTAEYPNALIYGDGANNNGTMSVKNTSDANWRNYYEWHSHYSTLQDYTVILRYELPPDFSSWPASNAIKLGYNTQTALNADNKADVIIYRAGSADVVASSLANVSTAWSEIIIDDSSLGAWSAGDIMIMEIKVYSKNGNFVRIGDITLNYTR